MSDGGDQKTADGKCRDVEAEVSIERVQSNASSCSQVLLVGSSRWRQAFLACLRMAFTKTQQLHLTLLTNHLLLRLCDRKYSRLDTPGNESHTLKKHTATMPGDKTGRVIFIGNIPYGQLQRALYPQRSC